MSTHIVTIEKRFCGPRQSANGGYAAGVFSQIVNGPARVRLKAPPPLDTPIDIRNAGDGAYEAIFGDTVIATITPSSVSIDPPPLPCDGDISKAHDCFLEDAGGEHILPYCFVCGNKREPGDGLRIFSGPAPDSPINADFWTPVADLADIDGFVRAEFMWAALDCPSAFALRNGLRLSLLGSLEVDIKRRPKLGEKLIVAAWRTGQDGRKHFSSSALYDGKRNIIAAANAVWIEINDPAFLRTLKDENA